MTKVIHGKNLPARLPVAATIGYLTALSYWNAPQWLWGIALFVLVIVWIAEIIRLFDSETVDIFDGKQK